MSLCLTFHHRDLMEGEQEYVSVCIELMKKREMRTIQKLQMKSDNRTNKVGGSQDFTGLLTSFIINYYHKLQT